MGERVSIDDSGSCMIEIRRKNGNDRGQSALAIDFRFHPVAQAQGCHDVVPPAPGSAFALSLSFLAVKMVRKLVFMEMSNEMAVRIKVRRLGRPSVVALATWRTMGFIYWPL